MPQFYFDLRRHKSATVYDEEGSDLPSAEDAYLEAFESARELWGDFVRRHEDPRRHAFEVRDVNRNVLFILPFQEVIDSCANSEVRRLPFSSLCTNAGNAQRALEGFQQEME